MSKFSLIAMGGTFDIIHRGHLTLLENAFEISDKVIIGLTSDEFVQKKGKTPIHKYDERLKNLISIIFQKFPNNYFEDSEITIINSNGQVVKKQTVSQNELTRSNTIEFNGLNSGFYIVKIQSAKFSKVIKLIVQ